ncbi:MAG: response regulator transcription factor [Candidatus Azobacteroides sp.]|nr:response regulator transcription factor [Candidatus Azobacteroides sp.]
MKILIIEDEEGLRNTIKAYLEKEMYIVETASDFTTASFKINDYDYDCVLLDIMLPGGNGLTLLETLKKMHKRENVIIISAKDSLEDKITGLDLGADDYIAKPFHLAELNARIKSVLRRKHTQGETSIVLENVCLFPDKRIVKVKEKELVLNRKEYDLLYYFISNPEQVIHKMVLAEYTWGDNIDQADSLDFIYSQVKNLRKKLKQSGAIPSIVAVYGFGYKLVCKEED